MCDICAMVRPYTDVCDYEDITADNLIYSETIDASASAATIYTMSPGDYFDGTVSFLGDRDWVQIDLTAGVLYDIEVQNFGLADTYLRVFDALGNLVDFDDDSGLNTEAALYDFVVATSGTYYIEASAWGDSSTGAYSIYVSPGGTPPPPPLSGTVTAAEAATQLTDGYWNATGRSQRSFDVTTGGTITVNLLGLTADGRYLAEQALLAWEYVSGLNFVETTGSADITFDDNAAGASNSSITSGSSIVSSSVNVSTQWLQDNGTSLDSYSFQTYLHEIGHALGLGHAGNYNSSATYGVDELFDNDSWQMSVMSYFSQTENTAVNASFAYTVTPMLADIIAIQTLYGTAGNIRTGNTVYGDNSTAGGYYNQITSLGGAVTWTILDNGGEDTLDLSSASQTQRVDLKPGSISDVYGLTGNLSITGETLIERVIGGTGADTILGNIANNRLMGEFGNDVLLGRGGNDMLFGGAGLNQLLGGSGGDSLTGGGARDILRGGKDNDVLIGGGGQDTLKGSWGDDTLTGGAGADVFKFKLGVGNDLITDFEDGTDHIRITTGAAGIGDLTISDTLGGAQVSFSTVTILLTGITAAQLSADDFIFG